MDYEIEEYTVATTMLINTLKEMKPINEDKAALIRKAIIYLEMGREEMFKAARIKV